MYQRRDSELLVLLVHPGGPYWARKDIGAWSIPKGEFDPHEDLRSAALREFEEELGVRPSGTLLPLGAVVQKSGKRVTAFALAGDLDVTAVRSNSCVIEWPAKSGRMISVPEVDRAEWLPLAAARRKINPAQEPLLDRLVELAGRTGKETDLQGS